MTFGLYDKLTYWTEGDGDPSDPFSDGSWSSPTVLACEFKAGSEIRKDKSGAEFMPKTVYYTAVPIPYGAKIVPFKTDATAPPTDAETNRFAGDGTVLPGQSNEYESYTG